jgi:hypothetical protein
MAPGGEPDPFKVVFLFAVGFYLLSQLWVYRVQLLQKAVSYLPNDTNGGDLDDDAEWMDDKKKRKGGGKKAKGN